MTLSENEHAAPPPISLVPTAPTCDAEPMRIAIHGDAAFLQGWKAALERASDADVICLAATDRACAELLIASDAASDLATVGGDRYAAVVLVLRHDQNGTIGIVLNRPTNVAPATELPELAESVGTYQGRLFRGGLIAPTRLLYLVRGLAAAPFVVSPLLFPPSKPNP